MEQQNQESDYLITDKALHDTEGTVETLGQELANSIGERLVSIRKKTTVEGKKQKVTTEFLATWTGITRATWSAYENGDRLPSLKALNQLAFLYGCDIKHLLGEPYKTRDIEFMCKELGLSQSGIEKIEAEKEVENNNEILSWFLDNGLPELLRDLKIVDSFDKELLALYASLPEQLRAKLEYISLTPLEKEQNYNIIIGTVIETLASLKTHDYVLVRNTIKREKTTIEEKSKTIVFPFIIKDKISMATKQAKRKDEIPTDYLNDIAELSLYVYLLSYVYHKYQKDKQQLIFKISNSFTNLLNQYCTF